MTKNRNGLVLTLTLERKSSLRSYPETLIYNCRALSTRHAIHHRRFSAA